MDPEKRLFWGRIAFYVMCIICFSVIMYASFGCTTITIQSGEGNKVEPKVVDISTDQAKDSQNKRFP